FSNCQSSSAHPLFPLFFFNDPTTTEIYTLSLHDALPILRDAVPVPRGCFGAGTVGPEQSDQALLRCTRRADLRAKCLHFVQIAKDRKSTRLNSSHVSISYAVFCLKKKKTNTYYIEV